MQQSLELKDEDIKQIEQPILAAKHQEKLKEKERLRQQQQENISSSSQPRQEGILSSKKVRRSLLLVGSTVLGLVLIFSALINSLHNKTRVDYGQLQKLLQEGDIKKAAQESNRAMLKASGNRAEQRGYLLAKEVEKFSCNDLKKLYELWYQETNDYDDIEKWGRELTIAANKKMKERRNDWKSGIIKGGKDIELLEKRADECGI